MSHIYYQYLNSPTILVLFQSSWEVLNSANSNLSGALLRKTELKILLLSSCLNKGVSSNSSSSIIFCVKKEFNGKETGYVKQYNGNNDNSNDDDDDNDDDNNYNDNNMKKWVH